MMVMPVSEDWGGISTVLTHESPEDTHDIDCNNGSYERDDPLMENRTASRGR
jgi:hypothetical protein